MSSTDLDLYPGIGDTIELDVTGRDIESDYQRAEVIGRGDDGYHVELESGEYVGGVTRYRFNGRDGVYLVAVLGMAGWGVRYPGSDEWLSDGYGSAPAAMAAARRTLAVLGESSGSPARGAQDAWDREQNEAGDGD